MWPRSPVRVHPWRVRLRRWISARVLSFVGRLRRRDGGEIQMLQLLAERYRPGVRVPTDVTISISQCLFLDVIFIEDFARLAAGLRAFLTRFSDPGAALDVDQWLNSRSCATHANSWHCFRDARLDVQKDFKLLRGCDFFIVDISPSAVVLIVRALPSAAFDEKFGAIIAEETHDERELYLRFFRRRGLVSTGAAAWIAKRDRLTELSLAMNREVSAFLVDFNIGDWASVSPLPCIQIFDLAHGAARGEDSNARQFWNSLGMGIGDFGHSKGGVDIYQPNELFEPFRVLVDSSRAQIPGLESGCAVRWVSLWCVVEPFILMYARAIALLEHCSRTFATSGDLRREAGAILKRKRGLPGGWIPRLIGADFQHARLLEEVDHSELQRDFSGMNDFELLWDGQLSLSNYLLDRIKYLSTMAATQLSVIRRYAEVANADRLSRLSLRLAWLGIGVALLALFLGVLGIIPDDIKGLLYNSVAPWLHFPLSRGG